VELRIFGGHSIEEAARFLDIGATTVKSDWQIARAWLKRELATATEA
jgi:DNA-directed RNA polymerase specialized sigma24 family protein